MPIYEISFSLCRSFECTINSLILGFLFEIDTYVLP